MPEENRPIFIADILSALSYALDLTEGEIVIDDALNYPHTLD